MKFPAIPTAKFRMNQQYDLAAGQTFKSGASVTLSGAQEVAESGADPALILGFAAEPAVGDPESATKVIIHKAGEGQKFWMDVSVAPVKADIGASYGITKDADGFWYVDKAKTAGSARVYVHNIDTERNLVEVSVLIANRQVLSS